MYKPSSKRTAAFPRAVHYITEISGEQLFLAANPEKLCTSERTSEFLLLPVSAISNDGRTFAICFKCPLNMKKTARLSGKTGGVPCLFLVERAVASAISKNQISRISLQFSIPTLQNRSSGMPLIWQTMLEFIAPWPTMRTSFPCSISGWTTLSRKSPVRA